MAAVTFTFLHALIGGDQAKLQRLLASFGAGVPGGPGLPSQTMATNV
jgi:hypothetical protein